jgi:hypothetical protein
MRPLPPNKTHGIIHSVRVTKENASKIAKDLGIPEQVHRRLRDWEGEVHIVREAKEAEVKRDP